MKRLRFELPRVQSWPASWTWLGLLVKLDTFLHRHFSWCQRLWRPVCSLTTAMTWRELIRPPRAERKARDREA